MYREDEGTPKIDLMPFHYASELREGFLDVACYVKSIEAVWRRLKDIPETSEDLVVFMNLVLSLFFGTPNGNLERDHNKELVVKLRAFSKGAYQQGFLKVVRSFQVIP